MRISTFLFSFYLYKRMQIPLERNAVSNYDGMTVPTQRHAFPV